ncbi:CCAAT/enhancer-binding protein zeta-like [Argiope bruennichi]|uniref:CCAAT/enhancer-binding protein zeta-like n=1 Tax=Argiope bruennichi TaxID=94029 RepID=UPI00249543E1|nr:CCAAT/enhancer-binding protein zeta-like [Argiope bruennichi]
MKFKEGIQKLSMKPGEKWFEQFPVSKIPKANSNPDVAMALKAEAENLLDSETRLYHRLKENQRSKDFSWIKKILQAGTLSDKISAHTMLIQDSPVYNLSSLENLIGLVNTKGKRECLMAMDTLQDLFIGDLLLEDRKLRMFNEQPLEQMNEISQGDTAVKKQLQILWIFEERLKLQYKKFLSNLVAVSHDTIEKTKVKAVSVMAKLLMDNCEEEQFLLENLVNKIGDPIPKVGSHSCHQLGAILNHHTNMKTVIVQEVERLIFRPNLAERAKYYALCFLNQVILSHDEFALANHLIMIYFGQFKLFVKTGEVNTKMMSALLTGVARAYPYAKLKDNIILEQLDAMYRLVHMVSFNISVQALMLIFQVLDSSDSVSDRFYGVLYRKLLDPALSSSSRQASVLNLVFRALKKDVAVVRVKAFVKRLLQVALCQAPTLQCGILILISELNKIHPTLLETKRAFDTDDESDEHYEDVPSEDEDGDQKSETKMEESDVKPEVKPSWVHKQQRTKNKKTNPKSAYDFNCRNPLHANAECQGLWELLFLKQSFHPSVSLFAHQVSNATEIKYSGDPLLDFTTTRFLDRFVYRNPKKNSENFLSDPKNRVFGPRKLKESKKMPILEDEYLQQKEDKVPIEERFIYKYLRNRAAVVGKKKDDSDIESVGSDEFQKLLDEIHPEDEGDDSLNFAKELGLQKLKKGKKRTAHSDDEEASDNISDEESDFEDLDLDDEELGSALGDLDDEDFEICEEDFVDEGGFNDEERPKKKKKKMQNFEEDNTLADADEFSALLEEAAEDNVTSEAFKRKDKSSAKQLKWEMDRDRFIKNKTKKSKFFKKKSKKQRKA